MFQTYNQQVMAVLISRENIEEFSKSASCNVQYRNGEVYTVVNQYGTPIHIGSLVTPDGIVLKQHQWSLGLEVSADEYDSIIDSLIELRDRHERHPRDVSSKEVVDLILARLNFRVE